MKMMIIATMVAGTLALSHTADATPRGHYERHHSPLKGLVHQLHGLSLSSAQRAEITSLIARFQAAQTHPKRTEPGSLALRRSVSEESIRRQAEESVSQRETQGLKIAALRSQVFAVLTVEQQSTLLERAKNLSPSEVAKNKKPPRPFKGIALTDEQRERLHALRASFSDVMEAHKANMAAFREAQANLMQSGRFSRDNFEALTGRYHEAMVNAEVDKALNQQAMLAVLTDEQIAQLDTQNKERAFFRKLLKRG